MRAPLHTRLSPQVAARPRAAAAARPGSARRVPAATRRRRGAAARGEPPVRIVLADDHPTARRNLRALLDGQRGLTVIAEAGDLAEMLRATHEHTPQVVVLDLQMPSGSSIEAIGYLRSHAPGTGIVVSTMETSPLFAEQALQAGAIGFVRKDRADSELADAVRAAAAGKEYVSAHVTGALAARHPAPWPAGVGV